LSSRIHLQLTEESLLSTLEHFIGNSNESDKADLVLKLEDLSERLTNGIIINQVRTFDILVRLASLYGGSNFESLLIRDSLVQIIKSQIGSYDILLNHISNKETGFVLCFLKILEQAEKYQKSQAIKSLIDFLASQSPGQTGAKEVYEAIINLGTDGFSSEIVMASLPYLDSSLSKPMAIITGLRLASKFADTSASQKILGLFDKALKGYFGDNKATIIIEACSFIQRTSDQNSLPILFKLFRQESTNSYSGETQALAAVLKANPSRMNDVLEFLYDMRKDNVAPHKIMDAIEQCGCEVNIRKLLNSLPNDWIYRPNITTRFRYLIIKTGKQSKQLLFELLRDDKTYEFALDCLTTIGVSREEISCLFAKLPVLQIYNFFYDNQSENLNSIVQGTKRLEGPIHGKPTTLDFMINNILSSFNFVTLNVDGSGKQGVDLIGFNPETLECLIIGCTAGTIKNDISTMSVQLSKMKAALPELMKSLKITPLIISSAEHTFLKSDIHDANQVGITLLSIDDIKAIVEMLETGRKNSDFIQYIKNQSHNQQSIDGSFVSFLN